MFSAHYPSFPFSFAPLPCFFSLSLFLSPIAFFALLSLLFFSPALVVDHRRDPPVRDGGVVVAPGQALHDPVRVVRGAPADDGGPRGEEAGAERISRPGNECEKKREEKRREERNERF